MMEQQGNTIILDDDVDQVVILNQANNENKVFIYFCEIFTNIFSTVKKKYPLRFKYLFGRSNSNPHENISNDLLKNSVEVYIAHLNHFRFMIMT